MTNFHVVEKHGKTVLFVWTGPKNFCFLSLNFPDTREIR